jgi:hypothetical protein
MRSGLPVGGVNTAGDDATPGASDGLALADARHGAEDVLVVEALDELVSLA